MALDAFMPTPFSAACPGDAAASASMPAGVDPGRPIVTLTRGLAAGREDCFVRFHRDYFDRLLRYLLVVTRGEEQAARDALQETFLRVARHARPFQTEEAFWSWLTVLARSAAIDGGRRQSRYRRLLARLAGLGETPGPSDSQAADQRLHRALELGMEALDPLDRELVRAKYLRGDAIKAIAGRFNLTGKAVESRLHRARRRLRALLQTHLNDES